MSDNYYSNGSNDLISNQDGNIGTTSKTRWDFSEAAFRVSSGTWVITGLGTIMLFVLTSQFGLYALLFALLGSILLGLGFALSFILAVIGLFRKDSPLAAVAAFLLNFPLYYFLYIIIVI